MGASDSGCADLGIWSRLLTAVSVPLSETPPLEPRRSFSCRLLLLVP